MSEEIIFEGYLIDDSWLTLEQLAAACAVEPEWLLQRLRDDLFPHVDSVAGVWRFSPDAIQRARRMYCLERDFDAVPELAALVADVLEERDALRAQLGRII